MSDSLSAYLALTPSEQLLIDFLVLVDDALSPTILEKGLYNWRKETRSVPMADAKTLCERLAETGLIETSNRRYQASEAIKGPVLNRLLRSGRFLALERWLEPAAPLSSLSSWGASSPGLFQRALFSGDDGSLWDQIDAFGIAIALPVARRLDGMDLLDIFTEAGRSIVIWAWLVLLFTGEEVALTLSAGMLADRAQKIDANADRKELLMIWTAMIALSSGDVAALSSFIGTSTNLFMEPALAYLRGQTEPDRFKEILMAWRKKEGKRQGFPCDPFFIFYLLLLVEADGPAESKELLKLCRWGLRGSDRFPLPLSLQALQHVAELRLGDVPERDWLSIRSARPEGLILDVLDETISLILYALTAPVEAHDFLAAKRKSHKGNPVRNPGVNALPAAERALLQARMEEKDPPEAVMAFFEERQIVPLCDRLLPRQDWEGKLETLLASVQRAPSGQPQEIERRLLWLMDSKPGHPGSFSLEAREQKRLKSGAWSKGRKAAIERLIVKANCYPDEDRAILSAFEEIEDRSWGRKERLLVLNEGRAIPAMAAHDRVVSADDPQTPLTFEERPLSLCLEKKRKGWVLSLQPPTDLNGAESDYVLWQEEPHHLFFTSIGASGRSLASYLGKKGLVIPAEGEQRLFETLQGLAPLVNVDPALSVLAEKAETAEAESLPSLRFQPRGEGVTLRVGCRPLGDEGAFLPPGQGRADLVGSRQGRPVKVHRDLEAERAALDALLEACPVLTEGEGPHLEQELADLESTLELLLELQEGQGLFRAEWPEGKPLSVGGRADVDRLSLRVRRRDDWLAIEGEVTLDEGRVVALKALLASVEGTKRFISIGDGAFLALSSRLKKRLEGLAAMARKKGGDEVLPLLAAPFLAEAALDSSVEGDSAWEELKGRLREAGEKSFALPRAFRGRLRDYQSEGFSWLASLAHWGGGACLADDMGLGKTIQALALLIHRQGLGPALVVAPTSVCSNWEVEAQRFAPGLKALFLASGDRERMIRQAGPGDVVLCSWTLLQQEKESLTSRSWATVVLDEAQSMKNPQTRRAQAAVALRADFRLALSGTPVENSLVELWSLFRFLNPGLLGSLEAFRRRFVAPIEERGDRDARSQLRRLVRPFILRRTKEEVLEELPSLTEITLDVELSDDERAFYEALRREALEKLETRGDEGGRFQILAQLMRLRRAACHPRLVADIALSRSSKMDILLQSLEEIGQGGHRALVFSQFVDHLSLVRQALDEEAITYQYLDGSTPQKKRAAIVEAFQRGEGDCFLISLRAGGLGLNLTGADYVIHLDPWWNPAVEDQATDRAHRIGQDRPVTVLRLVAKGTVEEKIVALHRDKRELAQALLDGTDRAVTLTEEELRALLKN